MSVKPWILFWLSNQGNKQGASFPPDWTEIGYEDTPDAIINGFDYAREIYDNWDATQTTLVNKYVDNLNLLLFPMVDTSEVINMDGTFKFCRNLIYIPLLDTSKVTNLHDTFRECSSLKSIPLLDTSEVTTMYACFRDSGITQLPLLDTSKLTTMREMFNNCRQLLSVPLFDTSNVTSMQDMLINCKKLTEVPLFDTSKVTSMKAMLAYCDNLERIPAFDMASVTDLTDFVKNCNKLSNDSLNNIMASLLTATSYTGTKTLNHVGLSSAQATTCTTLSNWTALSDAGWTTGY